MVDAKNRDVDHKFPVIDPEIGWVNWDSYFMRLLDVHPDNLSVVCKACHKRKTKNENQKRRKKRTKSKKVQR